jgi:hypothetical protein
MELLNMLRDQHKDVSFRPKADAYKRKSPANAGLSINNVI